jgi:hypothetical protein
MEDSSMKRVMLALAVAFGLSAAATAQPIEDQFFVSLDPSGNLLGGGGSGFNNGAWYYYPDTGWYNQWFYDHPFDPDRWKTIHIEFDAAPLNPGDPDLFLELAVNWSTPEWSGLGFGDSLPPVPGAPGFDEPLHIERFTLLETSFFFEPYPEHFEFDYVIPDYNPEWVSIDVYGWNVEIINGIIIHDCIPAPGALALLGVAGMLGASRRRR